jgi:hypothetical protein
MQDPVREEQFPFSSSFVDSRSRLQNDPQQRTRHRETKNLTDANILPLFHNCCILPILNGTDSSDLARRWTALQLN